LHVTEEASSYSPNPSPSQASEHAEHAEHAGWQNRSTFRREELEDGTPTGLAAAAP
jgi:hypothetical protein